MRTRTLWEEIKRFISDNNKLILLFMLIGSIIYSGFIIWNTFINDTDLETDVEDIEQLDFDTIDTYATFSFYVEKEDGSVFNYNALLEDMYLDEANIELAEFETGIEISKYINKQEEEDFVLDEHNRGFIGIRRDFTNESMVFEVKLGTESQQLELADYYFDEIVNTENEFFENKTLYVIERPNVVEVEDLEDINNIEEADSNIVDTVIGLIIALVASLLISILCLYLKSALSSTISYAFDYEVEQKDLIIIERNNLESVKEEIVKPNSFSKIIVSPDNSILNKLDISNNKNISIAKDLLEIDTNKEIDEIVILVKEKYTTKDWYNRQRDYHNRIDGALKVIQYPSSLID